MAAMPVVATDSELESAPWLPPPAAQAPAAPGRAGVAKVAVLLGMVCAIGFVAYGATPAKSPGAQEEGAALGFDAGGIIQKASSANHTCPTGYFVTHLDMMNHDADMHGQKLSADDCAAECNKDADCNGFEYNEDADDCWVTRAGHHCTDRQHQGWVSCFRSNATCPAGYTPTDLDMMNHDADMHDNKLSAEDCAEECDKDDRCAGFEHNVGAAHCWISRSGHHCTEKQHAGWASCVKVA